MWVIEIHHGTTGIKGYVTPNKCWDWRGATLYSARKFDTFNDAEEYISEHLDDKSNLFSFYTVQTPPEEGK